MFGRAAPEGGEDTGGSDEAGGIVGELVVSGGKGDDGFGLESKPVKVDGVRKAKTRDDVI